MDKERAEEREEQVDKKEGEDNQDKELNYFP